MTPPNFTPEGRVSKNIKKAALDTVLERIGAVLKNTGFDYKIIFVNTGALIRVYGEEEALYEK